MIRLLAKARIRGSIMMKKISSGMRLNNRVYPREFCDTHKFQTPARIQVTRQRGGRWFVFEQVPACVCSHCGHRCFDADTVDAVEVQLDPLPVDARPIEAWAIAFSK